MDGEELRIIPLGGLGEIGKNMMVVESGDTMIIVDAGMMFPDDTMPGIDFVIPDFSYVLENRKKIRGIILTHGHEDHIGALPYLLSLVDVPVFGTKLTLGFARNRIEDHSIACRVNLHEVNPREPYEFGDLKIEFFRVCHSIADGVGLSIETPAGYIVHSGDFKFDLGPSRENFDFFKLTEYGEKGVILLLSDSTNAESKGFTPSERELYARFRDVISNAPGRVIVATFASNIHRIQQVFDVSVRSGKRVAILGKSMEKNIEMGKKLGYLHFNERILISSKKLQSYRKDSIVLLTTGSQGEPMSALSRIIYNRHRLDIEKSDTVILSSSIIPGNEKTVTKIVNDLFKRGAQVYYEGVDELHVSGHASREELKLLIAMTKPKYFMPIHGEFRHLITHVRLAKEMGVPEKNIILCEDGDVVSVRDEDVRITDRVRAGHVYIDGKSIGAIEATVLEDRHKLSRDGIVIVALPVLAGGKKMISPPDIYSRGFIHCEISSDLFEKAKTAVYQSAMDLVGQEGLDHSLIKACIVDTLKSFFRKQTSRVPIIVPLITEVKG